MLRAKLKRTIALGLTIIMLLAPVLPVWALSYIAAIGGGGTWSTTFDEVGCATSDFRANLQDVCGGIYATSSGTCPSLSVLSTVETAANYALGGGGNGFRKHYSEYAVYGTTGSSSFGVEFALADTITEFWVRWYDREYTSYNGNTNEGHKVLYWHSKDPIGSQESQYSYIEREKVGYYEQGASPLGAQHYGTTGRGWRYYYGGGTDVGDGSWHLIEHHLKMDTNGTDGVVEIKIDGELLLSHTNVDMDSSGTRSFGGFSVVTNSSQAIDVDCAGKLDVDDIAVSTAGWIGAVTQAGNRKANPSLNFRRAAEPPDTEGAVYRVSDR